MFEWYQVLAIAAFLSFLTLLAGFHFGTMVGFKVGFTHGAKSAIEYTFGKLDDAGAIDHEKVKSSLGEL